MSICTMKSSFSRVLFVACLCGAWFPQASQAQERTRTFADYKARYTLPGDDWSWNEGLHPNMVFKATSSKGFIIMLVCMQAQRVPVNDEFAKGFDKTFFVPTKLEKRGGSFLTFKGLACYQAEGVYPADGRTVAARVFLAHGWAYDLLAVGDQNPIEKQPEFDAMMSKFEFTTAPSSEDIKPQPPSNEYNISYQAGRIAGTCLLAALVFLLIRWIKRSMA